MNRLSQKLADLLIEGVKMAGNYSPSDVLMAGGVVEDMTLKQAEIAENFLGWVSEAEAERHFGQGNIQSVYSQFLGL